MRKALKRKRLSCGLCKPYKVGWDTRWRAREFGRLREAEREMRAALRR